jgi:hypothetical protein
VQDGRPADTIALGNYDAAWQVAGGGDFNADRNGDILWHNNATGQTADWLLATHHALTAGDFLFA